MEIMANGGCQYPVSSALSTSLLIPLSFGRWNYASTPATSRRAAYLIAFLRRIALRFGCCDAIGGQVNFVFGLFGNAR